MAATLALAALPGRGGAQTAPAAPMSPASIVRQIPMKDARAAQMMKERLDALKSGGAFRDVLAGPIPNQPITKEVQFLVAGNVLMVIGEPERVARNMDAIQVMAYMGERPRAHLSMTLRVVQISGPANAEVTQLSEAVQALVQAQRDEVVRTFADLGDYLRNRLRDPNCPTRELLKCTDSLLPSLGNPDRTLSVPETLLLLMLDRLATRIKSPKAAAVNPMVEAAAAENEALRDDLLALPRSISHMLADSRRETAESAEVVLPDLERWLTRAEQLRQRFHQYGVQLQKSKDGAALRQLKESLTLPDGGIPDWIGLRLSRSLELTERLFPNMAREHAIRTVACFERKFEVAVKRGEQLRVELEKAGNERKNAGDDDRRRQGDGKLTQLLLSLKSLSESLAPPPMKLFDEVANVIDAVSPSAEEVVANFRDYSAERRKLDARLDGVEKAPPVNYALLQELESKLNIWLRRSAEALGRALEQQFYSQYTNELRQLANKNLGRTQDRDIELRSDFYSVPDRVRNEMLAGSNVNIFVSNSMSLQFAPDTTNNVSANVQQSLPSQKSLGERLAAAQSASGQLKALNAVPGMNLDPAPILGSLLQGGEPMPVRGGMSFSATPSIGYDGGTVSLVLSTNQTLEPTGSEKVADRVASHSIGNATVTAISYEPMVLSTLASNTSYYEETGGIPIARRVPLLKEMLNDIPIQPFQKTRRQRGIVQASVIILEPIVIPTIEDLVRYQSGQRALVP